MRELLVERANRLDGPFVRTEDRKLGRAAKEVDELGGQLSTRRDLPRTGATADERRERWDAGPANQ